MAARRAAAVAALRWMCGGAARREGCEVVPGYAAKTCQRMARQGDPTRGSHGRYHVNHIHREVVNMALEIIGKKVKRYGVG